MGFSMIISLFTSRIILNALGVESYGVMGIVGSTASMFAFLNGSMGASASRFLTFELGRKDEKKLNKVFNVTLSVHFVLAVIIVILCETIGLYLLTNKLVIPEAQKTAAFWVFQFSVISSFFSITQTPYDAVMIAHENMKIFSMVSIVTNVVRLLIAYSLLITPFDKLTTLSFLNMMSGVCVIIFYRIYCYNRYKETHLQICKEKSMYREILGFAGGDFIGNTSVMLQNEGANFLLNIFFGPILNAARNVTTSINGALTQFSGGFMTATRPQIIKAYAENKIDEMMHLVKFASWISYYLMWFLMLPVVLNIMFILKLWLKIVPDYSVQFMPFIMAISLIQTLKAPRTTVYHALGKVKKVNLWVGTILCLSFPLGYLGYKFLNMPPVWIFISIIISMLISEAASLLILKEYVQYSIKKYALEIYGRCFVVTAFSFTITYIFCNIISFDNGFIKLILTGLVSSISIISTVYLFGIDRSSAAKLKKIVLRKFVKAGRRNNIYS